jgi:hypothetical protein
MIHRMRRSKNSTQAGMPAATAAMPRIDAALLVFIVWIVSGERHGDDTSRAAS